jgi:hypothetical protein
MRWSRTLIPTLREAPADAVALSHKLMVRAGLIRQVGGGAFVSGAGSALIAAGQASTIRAPATA